MYFEGRVEKRKLEDTIPLELRNQKSWVGFVLKPDGKRINKIPMNVMTGTPAKTNDPKTWTDFETAVNLTIERKYSGVGFVFEPPYVGVDLDHCVEDGKIAPYALEILKTLNSYSEFSPSGTGIHVICKGQIKRACKLSSVGLEIYTRGRFFTVTGDRLSDYLDSVEERTPELEEIFSKFVEKQKTEDRGSKILGLIAKSKDADKFQKLFSGSWEGDYPSQSEADLALSGKLAFWTGKDLSLMDSLFRQSGLFRPKWDEKHFGDGRTYGEAVLEKATSGCQEVFTVTQNTKGQHLTQGEVLTRDCEENIKRHIRDQQGNFFVVLPFDDHVEICQTNSTRFRNWKAGRYRTAHGSPPNNEAVKQARIQTEVKCEDSKPIELFNRVGWHEGAIYYDLTTSDWRGVRISKSGWDVVQLPPIFRRYNHQAEQVIPVKDGDPKDMFRFCNVHKDDHCLFIVAIATFFIPNIPHVIPNQNGEQGTGKSNNSRKIKDLADPSRLTLISSPKDLEQAQMMADKHWINTFDNLSKIPEWFSDFLCRAVTGEGDMKRSLYTNDDEFIRSYRRCFVLNGIGASALERDQIRKGY